MSTFSKIIVRCEVDVDEIVQPFKSVVTGRTPRIWQGVGVEFQLLFKRAGEILDIDNIAFVTLSVLAATRTGAAYMEQTVAAVDLDITVDADSWNDGSKQHAAIAFTGLETNLPGSAAGTEYFLILSGYTSDAPTDPDNFGWTRLTVHSDGVPTDEGPVQAGNSILEGAEYDGSGEYELAVLQDVFYRWTAGANDTSVVNGTETITTTNANFATQGTAIILHGTPSEPVTAVIRKSPTLPADEIAALIQNLIGDVVGVVHGTQALTAGVDDAVDVDISAHNLVSSPARVVPFIIKPVGGDNLFCTLLDGSPTATLFTIELSAPPPASGYKVGYLLVK